MINNFIRGEQMTTIKTEGFTIIPKGSRVSILGEWYMIDEIWCYPQEDKCNYKMIKL